MYVYIYIYIEFTFWCSILEKIAGLTGRAPEPCGWALCPGLVLLLRCVARLCVQALSSSRVLFLSSSSCRLVPLLSSSPPPLVLLVLSVATFSNAVGPPGVPSCPHATVANPVSFVRCLSRSACPACPRCGPVYHRLTRGLSPAWPRRFSYLHRLVWVPNCWRL